MRGQEYLVGELSHRLNLTPFDQAVLNNDIESIANLGHRKVWLYGSSIEDIPAPLYLAFNKSNYKTIKYLLEEPYLKWVNKITATKDATNLIIGEKLLLIAIKSGKLEVVQLLVKIGVLVTENCFIEAINQDNRRILKFLLETLPQELSIIKNSLLFHAINQGNEKNIKLLLDKYDIRVFHSFVVDEHSNQVDMFSYVLAKGMVNITNLMCDKLEVNLPRKAEKEYLTILLTINFVERLVNYVESSGRKQEIILTLEDEITKALFRLSDNNELTSIKYLLHLIGDNYGYLYALDSNDIDNNKPNLFNYAVSKDLINVVNLILNKAKENLTPESEKIYLVNLLNLEVGDLRFIKDFVNYIELSGRKEKILSSLEKDLSQVMFDLVDEADLESLELLLQLVDYNPQYLNMVDAHNNTLLARATYHDNYEVVKFLLKKGVIISLPNLQQVREQGLVADPFEIACIRGFEEVMHLLLEHATSNGLIPPSNKFELDLKPESLEVELSSDKRISTKRKYEEYKDERADKLLRIKKARKDPELEEVEKENTAAIKIQRLWRKDYPNYKRLERGSYIDVKAKSRENIAWLKEELQKLHSGSLVDQELSKGKGKEKEAEIEIDWLPKARLAAYAQLIDMPYVLRHDSEYDANDVLLANSILEELKIKYKGATNMEDKLTGNTGFVFFTLGMEGDDNLPEGYGYLGDRKYSYKFKTDSLFNCGFITFDDWGFYQGEEIFYHRFGDTIRTFYYIYNKEEQSRSKTYCYYNTKTGEYKERGANRDEEVFYGPDIRSGIALSVLLELKYIGGEFEKEVLANPKPELLYKLINCLYNIEAKVPRMMPLRDNLIEKQDKGRG